VSTRDRLVAIAALFDPDRAAALLGRLAAPDAPEAAALAARLAAAPRRERLHAFAGALGSAHGGRRARALAAAALERPRVAAVLRRLAQGGADAELASFLLVRLCRERIER